nr:glutamyl-tRNA reductase [Ktedonobacteraceae bacterium]
MHIIVIGVDHTTAPIALREKLVCSLRQVPQVLRATQAVVQESVLLSTCNRFEVYALCSEPTTAIADLLQVISETRQVTLPALQAHSYSLTDEQAVSHVFGVACGMQSQVPGEPQIQGQVAEALEIAQGSGYAGPVLSALFRAALVTGKRARSETGISRNAVSISHVAVQLARQLFPNLNSASVLLLGTGQMSELAARNLCDNGSQHLVIINRTTEHAVDLAERYHAVHRTFSELSAALLEADVVISSTRAPRAIITRDMVQEIMHQRHGRVLLLIDIALPRDIEPEVATIEGVYLYNLDDLQASVTEGIRLRMQEAVHVQTIVSDEVSKFERWLHSLSVVDTISDLRSYTEALRQQEVSRTMRQISHTLSEHETAAVQELTTRLLNKILHKPMLRLKDAAANGQGHIYAEALRYLFDLEEKTDEADYDRYQSQHVGNGTDTLGDRAIAATVADARDNYRADTHHR